MFHSFYERYKFAVADLCNLSLPPTYKFWVKFWCMISPIEISITLQLRMFMFLDIGLVVLQIMPIMSL